MSLENYAIFRAAPGSKADLAAQQIRDERVAAQKARVEFRKSIGALFLYASESHVQGAIFAKDATLPAGWRKKSDQAEGILAVPDKKKPAGKKLQFTLQDLPRLPGVEKFTTLIGGSMKIVSMRMYWCGFETHNGTLFVMTPLFPVGADEGSAAEDAPADQVFTPEGCERVPLSVYYAAKEADEAAAKAKGAVAA